LLELGFLPVLEADATGYFVAQPTLGDLRATLSSLLAELRQQRSHAAALHSAAQAAARHKATFDREQQVAAKEATAESRELRRLATGAQSAVAEAQAGVAAARLAAEDSAAAAARLQRRVKQMQWELEGKVSHIG
jgi:hypothetical protein